MLLFASEAELRWRCLWKQREHERSKHNFAKRLVPTKFIHLHAAPFTETGKTQVSQRSSSTYIRLQFLLKSCCSGLP